MTNLEAPERNPLGTTVGVLAAAYAATFAVALLLHVGVQIPLGFAVLEEPRRPFAVIVEGLAGIALALGAFAVFARKTWAWASVTGAHALALAGVVGDGSRRRRPWAPHPAQRQLPQGDGGAPRSGPGPAADTPRADFAGA
jgi:hypothetical protein